MPTHNAWRLASVWSIMLIPFTAQWLYRLFADEKRYLKYNFILFAIILVYFFNVQTVDYTNYSYTSREDLKIGSFIKNNLKFKDQDSKIYIARRGWNFTNILVSSQIPDRFITEDHIKTNISSDSILPQHIFEFKKTGIEYLVLTSGVKSNFDARHLDEIKRFDNWTIYKLH